MDDCVYIIFEGPDNCGKDTQIKKMLTYLANDSIYLTDRSTHILHYCNIPNVSKNDSLHLSGEMYHDMFTLLAESYYINNRRNFILNRSHIGEVVYSPIYRMYSGRYVYDIEKIFEFRAFFDRIVLITMYDDVKNLIDRDDGKSFTVDEIMKHNEILSFRQAHQMSYIKHKLLININNKTPDEVHSEIISFIEEEM